MLVVLYRLNSLHTFNTPNEEGAIQTQDAYFHNCRHTFRYNTYEDDEMVFPVHSQDMHSCTHDLSSISRAPLAFDPIVTLPGFGRNVLYGLQTWYTYIVPDNLQTDVPLHKRCAWVVIRIVSGKQHTHSTQRGDVGDANRMFDDDGGSQQPIDIYKHSNTRETIDTCAFRAGRTCVTMVRGAAHSRLNLRDRAVCYALCGHGIAFDFPLHNSTRLTRSSVTEIVENARNVKVATCLSVSPCRECTTDYR